jgi:hypothetical protein
MWKTPKKSRTWSTFMGFPHLYVCRMVPFSRWGCSKFDHLVGGKGPSRP